MFDLIFKDAPPNTFLEITRLPNDRQYFPTPTLPPTSIYENHNDVYFGPALRLRAGSDKTDVYGSRVLWADVDRPSSPLTTFPPSAIVHSGGGWHLYWLLDGWSTSVDAVETANKVVAEDTDADHCWNANRLLRIPGTRNTKYGPDVFCELRQLTGTIYSIDDFNVLGGLDSRARHKIRTGDRRGYKSRSERDWAVVEALVVAGATDALIEQIFTLQSIGDKYRDPGTNGKEYLAHTIEQIREKQSSGKLKRKGNGEITEHADGYYIDKTRGRMRLSTFIFKPTLLLENADEHNDRRGEDVIVGNMTASGHEWKDVSLPRSAFNDRRSLDRHLTIAAWTWLGRDDDVRALLPMLLKQLQDIGLPRTQSTSVLGRRGHYFVGNSQTLEHDTVYEGMDAPLVHHGLTREMPHIRFIDGAAPTLNLLPLINTPPVVWNLLGWFMATPYKPVLEPLGFRFPTLNLYGTRGSGKTTMIKMFQRMLGYEIPSTYDCNTTRFVTLTLLGCANAVPIAFSEFRQSTAFNFIRFVLLSYDTGHDPRGRADQTTIDHPLTAPFSIDGEDIINDAACRERMIAVNMHPETIAEGTPQYEAFRTLREQSLEHFALPYIQHTLRSDVDKMLQYAKDDIFRAFPEPLPDRVRNNMIVVRMGQISFQLHTDIIPAVPLREVFEPVLHSVWSPELGRSPTLVDEFTTGIVNAVARGRADFYFYTEAGVLWFQLATAFDWWLRMRRISGQSTLDREAVRTQLLERDVERGEKGQYIVKPRNVNGYWCYGVSLKHANESGLDVPDKLKEHTTRSTNVELKG